jgi:hypothetical protein
MAYPNWTDLISDEELEAQIIAAKDVRAIEDDTEPRAESVTFDQSSGLVVIALKNGAFFSVPYQLIQGLEQASPEDLSDFWIDASGQSVHWDKLDADFSIPGLVAGIFGTKTWMAQLGSKGGKSRSAAKASAARENGKKGGRPKKPAQVPPICSN